DAGQIPTREMLAIAAADGTIRRQTMYRAAALSLALFGCALLLGRDTHPVATSGSVKSPDALAEQARDVVRLAGHEAAPADFDARFVFAGELESPETDRARTSGIASLGLVSQDALLFLYRETASGSIAEPRLDIPFVTASRSEFDTEPPTGGSVT